MKNKCEVEDMACGCVETDLLVKATPLRLNSTSLILVNGGVTAPKY